MNDFFSNLKFLIDSLFHNLTLESHDLKTLLSKNYSPTNIKIHNSLIQVNHKLKKLTTLQLLLDHISEDNTFSSNKQLKTSSLSKLLSHQLTLLNIILDDDLQDYTKQTQTHFDFHKFISPS